MRRLHSTPAGLSQDADALNKSRASLYVTNAASGSPRERCTCPIFTNSAAPFDVCRLPVDSSLVGYAAQKRAKS